jgi:very-short-patch-repair endonuclease
MAAKLTATGRKWTRQSAHGFRLFDFWCASLGVAVEVDGPEHKPAVDAEADRLAWEISGILVLRVPNFSEEVAAAVLARIAAAESWKDRRIRMGLYRGKR